MGTGIEGSVGRDFNIDLDEVKGKGNENERITSEMKS